MAEWISVKDRLPSDGQYLICYKLNTKPQSYVFHVARFAENLHEVDEYDFDRKDVSGFYGYDSEWGYFKYHDVTHWMPLPPIPKEYEDG